MKQHLILKFDIACTCGKVPGTFPVTVNIPDERVVGCSECRQLLLQVSVFPTILHASDVIVNYLHASAGLHLDAVFMYAESILPGHYYNYPLHFTRIHTTNLSTKYRVIVA